jgi:PAS domain S-box-containing protein
VFGTLQSPDVNAMPLFDAAAYLAAAAAFLLALVIVLLAVFRMRRGAAKTQSEPEARAQQSRELEAVTRISTQLARVHEPVTVAETLLDEVAALFDIPIVSLVMIDEDRRNATLLSVRKGGEDVEQLVGTKLDLENEPSGVASAVFEATPFAVYDAATSPKVSRRLVDAMDVTSVAYVPLIAGEQVIAVLVAATPEAPRTFAPEELSLMSTLAAEAALALERTRSAAALAEALDRERLIARVSRKVRSELDLDALLEVVVAETGIALGLQRCFVRLGTAGGDLPLAAEWVAQGVESIGDRAGRLPFSNLAARDGRTVAVSDVRTARQISDERLGRRETLLELGTLGALATPIVVFGQSIGVFGLHRAAAGPWSSADIAVAEAVAREAGLAIHTTRLLTENARRLEQQSSLLGAAQALTGELELESVLDRLVEQVAQLLDSEAADCYLLIAQRGILRCAAVYGLDPTLVGFEFPQDRGVAGEALRAGRPVAAADYDARSDRVPHPAYADFTERLVAPMVWSGIVRGVLGVGAKKRGRNFTSADADLLEAFAGLASLALRNAESFAERSRQARIQRGFYRIAAVLGQSLSLVATLDAVVAAAGEALGGDFAAVLTPSGDTLALTGARDVPSGVAALASDGLPPGASVLVAAARERRIIAVPAITNDERFDSAFRDDVVSAGFRSLLAVPVEVERGEATGLVVVFFAEEHAFGDDDLELAVHLAGATRAALERSELFEAERTSRALAQQLSRTGSLLATELDPAAVLDEVVRRAPALLGADACTIRVLEGDELVVSAAVGDGAQEALGTRAPSTGWLSAEVVQSRRPVAIEDLGNGGRPASDDRMLAAGYRSFLGVPLLGAEGSLHGVLAIYAERPRIWRAEEIEALEALASNTSSALWNAELYQRVAEEQERSSAIIANIADGIVAVDRDGHVVLWNRAAEQITGVPQEEALGRPPVQILQRRLEADDPAPAGNRLVSIPRGADEVWLSLSEAVMRDPAGQVAGRIFAFRDISADRYVEQLKSDFVSAVSHELRSPLTSIYGFAETLLRQDVLFAEEERRTFLGYIASESERLTAIVDALLNVARLDSGDLQVSIHPVDVNAAVAEAVQAEEATSADGHRFVLKLPEEPVAAEADRDKLRQILAVLLDNAVRYSPGGGTVTVAARRRDDTVEIEVADEGIGIPPQEQERIFRKFYRAEGAAGAGSGGGTGLGLYIARGLVSAMGGRIWVRSTEGEGSSFAFELPLAQAPVPSVRE